MPESKKKTAAKKVASEAKKPVPAGMVECVVTHHSCWLRDADGTRKVYSKGDSYVCSESDYTLLAGQRLVRRAE